MGIAVAHVQSLIWELPHDTGMAKKKKKKEEEEEEKKKKERKSILYHLYMESKICTNELIYETEAEIHRHREQIYGCQGGGGWARGGLRVWD